MSTWAAAAGLFADRTRADLVAALLDGRALTAGELARATDVSAATASTHLRRLLDAGVLAVEAQGRHRYYRLVDERAANAFESLAALAPVRPVRSLRQSRVAVELRVARTCYDHLAGQVAVLLADRCVETGVLAMGEHGIELGDQGTGVSPHSGSPSTSSGAPGAPSRTSASTGASAAITWRAHSARRCSRAWSSSAG